MVVASEEYLQYIDSLKQGLNKAYSVASEARKQRFDPSDEVEIKIAKDVAARVEALVGPPGISKIIREMEAQGMEREELAFALAAKLASGEITENNSTLTSVEKCVEQAVRTSIGILTEGMLVAPTEGISKVKIKQNPDGTNYIGIYFTGPIRSAGGTVAALAVVLADYARKIAKIGDYRATESEIERYVEEVNIYEARISHLQYAPLDDDIRWIVKNCAVCIDGEPTEDMEVSIHRDLARMETNRIRGGIPLVMCEGIAQKATKVYRITKKFGLNWDWLEKLIKIKHRESIVELKPDFTYLEGLVAGRPVFAYPSTKGAFRLRYGKSRTNGLMAKNIHPATMIILDDFIAVGTHVKIERPGKGAVLSGCDSIEPPLIKLKNGSVVKVHNIEQAREIRPQIEKIIFLGDMLISYGDFLKSGHPLIPGAWCEEWWIEECKAKGVQPKKFAYAREAFEFAKTHKLPLHPAYVYFWHNINTEQLRELAIWIAEKAQPKFEEKENGEISMLVLPLSQEKAILEELGIEHTVKEEKIFISGDDGYALCASLGIEISQGKISDKIDKFSAVYTEGKKALEIVNEISEIEIKPKAPIYIGARMGRPEKAKERKMEGGVNALFPTGSPKNRSLLKLYRTVRGKEGEKSVYLELARLVCENCQHITQYRKCELCNAKTIQQYVCQTCGVFTTQKKHCGIVRAYEKRAVNIVNIVEALRKQYGFLPEDIKGVKGLFSTEKIPERLEKGFFRAKHNVYVFRDGTSRFDATDIPLTHFKPSEIGVSIEKLHKLGYTADYLGNALIDEWQIIPLHPQDVIISESGAEYFLRVAKFIDDMLVNLYGMSPFYKAEKKDELLGHLLIGLSPHTSSGVLVRVIGFTRANVGFGHPYFHTAKRRNCFASNTKIPILKNGEWKLIEINELVENNLKNPKSDDFGTVYSDINNLKTLTFNQKTKKFEVAKITHLSKHPVQKTMLLKTKSGREITVTPDHPFPIKQGKMSAQEISEVIVPFNIDFSEKDVLEFQLAGYAEDVMVKIPYDIFAGKNKMQIAGHYGLVYKTFTNYIHRRFYPLYIAKDLIGEKKLKKCKISAKRDTVELPYTIKCNEDFMFLLGAYLAKGHICKGFGKKTNYQIDIAASNKEVRDFFVEKVRKVFGIDPYVNDNTVTISSGILYSFFLTLGTGKNARKKSVPNFAFSLPRKKKVAILKGLFTGAGCVSFGSTLEVNLSSVSKRMIDEISFMLAQFGIKHSFSVKDDRNNPKHTLLYKVRMFSAHADKFISQIGFTCWKQKKAEIFAAKWKKNKQSERTDYFGDVYFDKIIAKTNKGKETVYSLTVPPHNTVIANGIVSHQCDGDEDALMLLLDGLLNFSKYYLSNIRGGTMDAPITLSTIIDPKEVDDEAHNMENVFYYPLEFYKAAERFAFPNDIKLKTVKNTLGNVEQYGQIGFTHFTSCIDKGPVHTAYTTLKSIPEKIERQFNLQKRLNSVNIRDIAKRLILSHFIPDLYGNLHSFSRQDFRCTNCNDIYRRPPLIGKCTKCGGNLILTINKGGIEKYLKISRQMADEYGLPDYLKQRLELIKKEIENIFEDEKVKQMGITEFM